MLHSASHFGISREAWEAAKGQARAALIKQAKVRGEITTSDLAGKIPAVRFDAFDIRLFHLLGEISIDEGRAGRGMLSAVVVRPAAGFFILAQHLGYDARDHMSLRIKEANKVYAFWAGAKHETPD